METSFSFRYMAMFLYRNTLSIIFATVICFISLYYTINSVESEVEHVIETQTKERVDRIVKSYGRDYKLLCIVTNCYAIREPRADGEHVTFYNRHIDYKGLYSLNLPSNDIKDLLDIAIPKFELTSIASYGNMSFYSTTSIKMQYVKEVIIYKIVLSTTLCVLILTFITVIVRSFIKRHQEMDDKNSDRVTLQRQLTESVHHELSAPLETIRCNLEAGFRKLYPCPLHNVDMCVAPSGEVLPECSTCKLYAKYKESKYRGAAWHYGNILQALEQVNSVLFIMSNNKHISHTNGAISLETVFKTITSSRRIVSLNLLNIKIHNLKDLAYISIGKTGGFTSGKLVNILNTLLTNSFEAHANQVDISWEMNPTVANYIDVYVKDNGKGIRDKRGRVVKDVKNFKIRYGYSTKVSDFDKGESNSSKFARMFFKYFKKLTNILGNDNDDIKVRGAGLFINKTILELAGGSFRLIENSESGCTFRISFPVQEKRRDQLEETVIK